MLTRFIKTSMQIQVPGRIRTIVPLLRLTRNDPGKPRVFKTDFQVVVRGDPPLPP